MTPIPRRGSSLCLRQEVSLLIPIIVCKENHLCFPEVNRQTVFEALIFKFQLTRILISLMWHTRSSRTKSYRSGDSSTPSCSPCWPDLLPLCLLHLFSIRPVWWLGCIELVTSSGIVHSTCFWDEFELHFSSSLWTRTRHSGKFTRPHYNSPFQLVFNDYAV